MGSHRIASLTTATGDQFAVIEERHPSRSYGRMFRTVFDDTAEILATKLKLASSLRLLHVLPRYLSYTEWKHLPQQEVAQRLRIDQANVSRGMAELVEVRFVERRGKGPSVEWKLTPNYGWRGDVASYHAERRKRGQPAPAAAGISDDCRIRDTPEIPRDSTGTAEQNGKAKQRPLRLLTPLKPPGNHPPAA